jgi:DNA-binding PadR family transcriptional regulator
MGSLQGLPEAHFHILIVLADGEKHGYSIMQEVAALTGGKTRLSPGTLYGAIQRLVEQGLIEEVRGHADASERRRYYKLSRSGRSAASAEVERLGLLLETARANGLAANLKA